MSNYVKNPPDASSLMTSARSFGNYDLALALADLIDNSITAKSSRIDITCSFNDGKPVIRQEFYAEVARQMHVPAPIFKNPDPNSPRTARAASNKRVCNARMLVALGVDLDYRSHTEGLHAIFHH